METLPRDVICYLSQWLSFQDLLRLSHVCKPIRLLVNHDRLWRHWAMLNFGQVSSDDLAIGWQQSWRDVCLVFNRNRNRWKHGRLKDCDGVEWPILFRTSDKCMLIPAYSVLDLHPRRGDIIVRITETNYEKSVMELSYTLCEEISSRKQCRFYYGSRNTPLSFCYPEFPPNYFFHRDKRVINIKLTTEMIDEMLGYRTLSIPGYPKIAVPKYEYPLALIAGVSIMTFCPSINALDEV